MAEINLGNEPTINVSLSDNTTLNASVPDINYIPGYKVAEEERRANEVIRQSNEANRIALYEDMENKLATGYFNGDDGVGLNYNWNNTSLGVKREDESEYSYTNLKGDKGETGDKGDKGDKGEPGEIKFLVVNVLPETGSDDTIYLLPLDVPDVQGNNYAEYIWINNAWELLGKIGVQVDLTDYIKNTDYATTNKAGVITANDMSGFKVGNAGNPYAETKTYYQYPSLQDSYFIGKGTLENVITGKGLIDKNVNDLTNYTKTSDLSNVATSGSYNDLSNKPTNVSTFTNDANYVTSDGASTTSATNTAITLFNTTTGLFKDISLKGNTLQTGTPTPSSPIPVNNVSGDNQVIVCGKNIFDMNIYSTTAYHSSCTIEITDNAINITPTQNSYIGSALKYPQYVNENNRPTCIRVKPSTKYTFSISNSGASYLCYIDKNYQAINTVDYPLNNLTTYSFTTPSNCYYVMFRLGKNSGTTPYSFENIQLEENETATTYEAYNGTTYNIDLPSGMELNKIGTYQDYIYKENDKWYLHKEIQHLLLNGSEDWSKRNDGDGQNTISFNIYNQPSIISVSADNIKCNRFGFTANTTNGIEGVVFTGTNRNQLCIQINRSRLSSLDATGFKTWLSNNNTNLYYVLTTSEDTEITYTPLIEQLESIKNAMSKEGTTNVNQVNNDAPFIITAEAFTDTYNGRYENILNMLGGN